MVSRALYSSTRQDWATPRAMFRRLDEKFRFTLDVCADHFNATCPRYFTYTIDGLSQDWQGERCFMNPPYKDVVRWTAKAKEEAEKGNCLVVGLMPSRTDTKWFHENVYGHAAICFIRGRLRFDDQKIPAPFPSLLAVWGRKFSHNPPKAFNVFKVNLREVLCLSVCYYLII